ncbi:hypothetical protein IJ472_05445 [bacterium]|nr:hypothetical protein [bacterium]
MFINFLTPKISNINTVPKVENSHNSKPVMQSKLSPLTADTVSFTGKDKVVKSVVTGAKKSTITLLDILGVQYEMDGPRYKELSKAYHRAIKKACDKLSDLGYKYDDTYNSQSPVKSAESYKSKIQRSKNVTVLDPIRGTIYNKDLYNLDSFTEFLNVMREEFGYVPYKTDVPLVKLLKRGYIPTVEDLQDSSKLVKVADLDFRLNNGQLDVDNMPESLRHFVSKPLKSGLEDIQLRFIRTSDINVPSPVTHELLIMFGPNSTLAKHQEHRDVYQWVRLFDEIEVPLEETSIETHSGKALTYMDRITEMFRGKVSQKLFLNAKNKDCLGINAESVIAFTEEDLKLFRGYFGGLNDRLRSVYRSKGRSREVLEMKERDMERIATIQSALKDTINFYNFKAGLPLITD